MTIIYINNHNKNKIFKAIKKGELLLLFMVKTRFFYGKAVSLLLPIFHYKCLIITLIELAKILDN